MEKLYIKDFGPIKEAEIHLNDINIFIGTTSSGKSTAAKLLAIFESFGSVPPAKLDDLKNRLSEYNIDFAFSDETELNYSTKGYQFIYTKKGVSRYGNFLGKEKKISPIYIPAERLFFSTVSQSIFSLINNDITLPKWLIDFGAKFEQARKVIKKTSINFLSAEYAYENNTDYIQVNDEIKIKLSEASSGLQSVIPLLLVVMHNTQDIKKKDLFVIEEPELNLYPSSQKELTEFIISRINKAQSDKLIITTHSPYLLTTIDNLIQAKKVADLHPNDKKEVSKLVKEETWVDFNKISCYYFDKGGCRSTLDMENQSIGPSNIDDVSIDISETFEKLLTLKYANA